MAGSYYDILGVTPQASPEAVRQAYRQRARALHPDRHSAATGPDAAQAGRAMQEVNEAWQVLGDAGRRSAYDRSLVALAGPSPAPAGPGGWADDDDRPYPQRLAQPGDVGISLVRGLPWMAVVVVLIGIFVFTAFAGGDDDDQPSAFELIGRCVVLEKGGVVTEVPCDAPSDGRVDLVVVRSSLCPDGSDVVRMPGESSWLCLRDPDRPSS
ncbi:MAG: J domain-containing protein [Acidimicrobiales bacterium]